jgi:hypothetical protein
MDEKVLALPFLAAHHPARRKLQERLLPVETLGVLSI